MLDTSTATLKRYLCVPLCIFLAIVTRLLLDPWLGDQFALTTVFFALIFTAWYGGFVPGLLSLVLGYLAADYFFITPRGSVGVLNAEQFVAVTRYAVVGVGTALMGGAIQLLRARAERSAAKIRRQALLID